MKFDARRNFLLALLAAALVAGCQSFPYLVGPKQESVNQTAPPVSQLGAPDETHASQWEAGRALYVGKCASCHKLKPIQEFAIDNWNSKIIPGMSVKAKLTPEQTQSLSDYIMAVKRFQLVGSEHAKAKPLTAPISASDNR
ncbi:MAG: hypothetical protein ABSG53_17970 [Thermoguttaceae bacterium]|jgi:mono/diheme cytochrome c family protein